MASANSFDLLITNASAVVPKAGIVECNIAIKDGLIKSLKAPADASSEKRIDAKGKYVLPGAIDPHVHYGVYTPIEQAALSESRSAAIGGITTMMRMLRLYDKTYNSIRDQLAASEGRHYIDYSIHASIMLPEQVGAIPLLKRVGINSLKIYMNLGGELNRIYMDLPPGMTEVREGIVEMSDDLMTSILEHAARQNATVLVHAEDPLQCSDAIKQGKKLNLQGLKAWSDCRPTNSEARSISKISEIGRRFHSNLYFVHVGSSDALDAIVAERQKGHANYYIETCPQYLTHSYDDYQDLKGKVVPPIRSKHDVQAMWYAIRNGIVDTIGTDHVANRLDRKIRDRDIWTALAGFPGLATMLPVLLGRGVNKGLIDVNRVAEITSYNTSRIFGLYPKKGTIQVGSDADLTIVDMDKVQRVTPELLQSYSDYTIYDGWDLQGWPIFTIVRGKVVMEEGQVVSEALGHGQFMQRPVTN